MTNPSEITTGGNVNRHQATIPDEELLALLFEAGRSDDLSSDAVVDVVQEALNSGRNVSEILDDADLLSRRQRESIQEIVRQRTTTAARRSTLAGSGSPTAPAPGPLSESTAATRRKLDREAEFRKDRDELLPTGEERYESVEEVGRGGWGVVVKANDRQLDREVAVKKLGAAASRDADIGRRFLHEARITARLQHPGIVPVYERGVGLEDKQPFYAMKLLNGDTLQAEIRRYHKTDAGPQKRQQFRRLLKAFVDICHAVSYAHSHNVIHRDLKPANIVVGEFGETIVVDWGLAKDLAEAETPEEANVATLPAGTPLPAPAKESGRLNGLLNPAVTQQGSVVGTPAYMPPEQARGATAEFAPSSDTYSLGVMLYVILTGKLPFHAEDVETTLQQVMRGDYRHPRAVDKRAPAPLASICVKAMSLRPEQRYQHAGLLGDDVARFLADEPVTAHKDTSLQKCQRWCRQHATIATSVFVGALTLTVVSVLAAVLIRRAHRAEMDARKEAVAAHQLEIEARQAAEDARADALERLKKSRTAADTWLIGLSGALERFPGMQAVRRDLITEALAHYHELQVSVEDDPDLSLESARCLLRIGDLHLLLAEHNEAKQNFQDAAARLSQLTSSYDQVQNAKAVPGANKARTGHGPNFRSEVLREQLNCETGLLLVQLEAQVAGPEQCQSLAKAASTLLRTLSSESNPELNLSVARAFLVTGRGLESAGRWESASQSYQDAFQSLTPLPPNWENTRVEQLQATLRKDHARVLTLLGKHKEAAATLQAAVDAATRQIDIDNERPDLLEDRAITHMKWANAQQRMGEDWAAEGAYRAAVRDLSHSWQLMFGDHYYSENLAVAQANLGQLALKLNQFEDAEQMLRSAVDQLTGLLESGLADRETVSRLAACNVSLGHVLVMTGNEAAAEQIQRSIQIFEFLRSESELSPSDQLAYATAMANLARVFRNQNESSLATTASENAANAYSTAIDRLKGSGEAPATLKQLRVALATFKIELMASLKSGGESQTVAIDELKQLANDESSFERHQPQSATQQLIRFLLMSNESDDWAVAEKWIHDAAELSSSSEYQQFQAILMLRQKRYDEAGEAIRKALSARRFPLALDYAIAAQIATAEGEHSKASDYRLRALDGLTQTPGDWRLRRWLEQSTESVEPTKPVTDNPTH